MVLPARAGSSGDTADTSTGEPWATAKGFRVEGLGFRA